MPGMIYVFHNPFLTGMFGLLMITIGWWALKLRNPHGFLGAMALGVLAREGVAVGVPEAGS